MPFHTDALAAIAPGGGAPPIPPHAMLRISADGERLGAALVVVGEIEPREAVDELTGPGVREAWLPVVTAMTSLAGGVVSSRTRFLAEPRGAIVVRYPDRTPESEPGFIQGIDDLAMRVGVSEPQRTLWRRLHPELGPGASVSVTTQCTSTGPTPELGFLYRNPEWDRAVTLATMIASVGNARRAAFALGTLSGTMQNDRLSGIELLLGPEALPDVVVWITLRNAV